MTRTLAASSRVKRRKTGRYRLIRIIRANYSNQYSKSAPTTARRTFMKWQIQRRFILLFVPISTWYVLVRSSVLRGTALPVLFIDSAFRQTPAVHLLPT
jgi:hypothetical protein